MGTREKILNAGVELLARNSFATVSMTDVAEACGITKPTIYYYFNSKKGLYLELARDILEQIRSKLVSIIDSDLSLREALIRIAQIRFESLKNQPDLVRAHFSFLLDPDIRNLIEPLQDEIMALQQAIVPKFTEAIQNGEIDPDTDPLLVSIMFHSTLNACLIRVLHGCCGYEDLPSPENIVDIIFQGIRTEN